MNTNKRYQRTLDFFFRHSLQACGVTSLSRRFLLGSMEFERRLTICCAGTRFLRPGLDMISLRRPWDYNLRPGACAWVR